MKIASIKTHLISVPVDEKSAWVSSLGRAVKRDALIVEVEADNGLVGMGECYHGSSPLVLERLVQTVLAPVLLGQDPSNLELNLARLYRRSKLLGNLGMVTMAISGLEIALWDLWGRHLGAPIYKLLGAYQDWAPVYVGGLCLGWKPVEELCAEARGYVAQGFRAMKLRVGRGIDQDVASVREVRQAVGPGVRIMVDANQGYSDGVAMKIFKEYEKYDLYWLEEPVPHEKLATMARLRALSFVNLAAGENSFSLQDFKRVLDNGAVDIIQPDACKIGGISAMKRVAVLAESHQMEVAPHIIGTSIALAAALQFIGSVPNGGMIEWDASHNNLFRDGIIRRGYELRDGRIKIPDQPGLGVEVDYDFLKQYPYQDGPCYV
ncbi:MAG: mandelate racemase/muconate lactonizing enzyme family protein [Thermodesulfobacteriota bacterium]